MMERARKKALPISVDEAVNLIGKQIFIKDVGLKEVGAVYLYINENGVVSVRILPKGEQLFYSI